MIKSGLSKNLSLLYLASERSDKNVKSIWLRWQQVHDGMFFWIKWMNCEVHNLITQPVLWKRGDWQIRSLQVTRQIACRRINLTCVLVWPKRIQSCCSESAVLIFHLLMEIEFPDGLKVGHDAQVEDFPRTGSLSLGWSCPRSLFYLPTDSTIMFDKE